MRADFVWNVKSSYIWVNRICWQILFWRIVKLRNHLAALRMRTYTLSRLAQSCSVWYWKLKPAIVTVTLFVRCWNFALHSLVVLWLWWREDVIRVHSRSWTRLYVRCFECRLNVYVSISALLYWNRLLLSLHYYLNVRGRGLGVRRNLGGYKRWVAVAVLGGWGGDLAWFNNMNLLLLWIVVRLIQ
jgi:hypothetical protein